MYKASALLGEIKFYLDDNEVVYDALARNAPASSLRISGYSNSNSLFREIGIPKGTHYVVCKVVDKDKIEVGRMSSKIDYVEDGYWPGEWRTL